MLSNIILYVGNNVVFSYSIAIVVLMATL